MSASPEMSSDWIFYSIGIMLVLLGLAFFLIPLLARSGAFSGIKVPWIILYTYKKDGFYFVTSPILIILSLISLLYLFLRR